MLSKVLDETIEYGSYYANWAQLLGKFVYPSSEIAIIGNVAVSRANELQKSYLPVSVFAGGELENLPLLQNRYIKDKTMIYVCVDKSCSLPVTDSDDALALIR
jgi:uncharacterized protein YyaL (SSP411 family)